MTLDEASVLIVDDRGRRWRLPRATQALDRWTNEGKLRVCREVATERDMLNVCGTFFELPGRERGWVCEDSTGLLALIASRRLRWLSRFICDQWHSPPCPIRRTTIVSDDGKAALWVGAIDDLWKLGRPIGSGGPWMKTTVKSQEPSDPYLMWAYQDRSLSLSHGQPESVSFRIELDLSGTGLWIRLIRSRSRVETRRESIFHPTFKLVGFA